MNEITETGERDAGYEAVFGDVSKIIDAARESAVRSVNAAMTAAYWLIGRRIVEFDQSGEERAEYGEALIERLSEDLTRRFGRGFSRQKVQYMRQFYLSYPPDKIRQTLSGKSARPLKDETLARYALEGLSNNVTAAEYRLTLPDEELLAAELDRTRQAIELRGSTMTSGSPTMSDTLTVTNPKK